MRFRSPESQVLKGPEMRGASIKRRTLVELLNVEPDRTRRTPVPLTRWTAPHLRHLALQAEHANVLAQQICGQYNMKRSVQ